MEEREGEGEGRREGGEGEEEGAGGRDLKVGYIALAHRQAWCFADCLIYFGFYQEITKIQVMR